MVEPPKNNDVYIPEQLFDECPIPDIQGDKNEDLLKAYDARGESLRNCSQDKKDIEKLLKRKEISVDKS